MHHFNMLKKSRPITLNEKRLVECPVCGEQGWFYLGRVAEIAAGDDRVRRYEIIGRVYLHPDSKLCDEPLMDLVPVNQKRTIQAAIEGSIEETIERAFKTGRLKVTAGEYDVAVEAVHK